MAKRKLPRTKNEAVTLKRGKSRKYSASVSEKKAKRKPKEETTSVDEAFEKEEFQPEELIDDGQLDLF